MPPAVATKQKRLQSKITCWFKQSQDGKQSTAKLAKELLDASPQRHVNALCFTHETLKRVFIKMITAVPLSAAAERVFSIGKDIPKPKRSGLSDIHFQMLIFLKVNK